MMKSIVLSVVAAFALAPFEPRVAGAQERPEPDRARLEGDVRRGFARAVRERVGLTEDQMRRLAPLAQRHEQRRRALMLEERRTRLGLQSQLLAENADTAAVAGLLNELVALKRRRAELLEAEHRDLATLMTPVQRARYAALQEQVRRRVQQMRQDRGAGASAR